MKHRLGRTILSAVVVLCAVTQATADSLDASIRQLESAVRPQRGGEHLNLLFALRQLRSPSLRPLFYELVQNPEWPVQVHAVLGLAELSDNKHIDPWLVRQMNPKGHEALIANALDLELLGVDQMRELIRHEELGAMPRLLILAELVKLGEPVDTDELAQLGDHAEQHVSMLAAALLMQLGDASKMSAVRQQLASVNDRERSMQLQWLFEAIRQYELDGLLPWVKETLNDETLADPTRFAGVFALASLGDAEVMRYWNSCLGAQPRHAQLIRYALLLFVCADTLPAGAFDALPADDTLLHQIAQTGRALQSGRNETGELIKLLDLNHRRSTELSMDHVKELPSDSAATVYQHLIDRLKDDRNELTADMIAVGVQATGELYKINPELVFNRLESAEDDSVQQQAILLGLMDAHATKVGVAASTVRRIGAGRADSLALLLMAKNLTKLTDEQIDQLGLIATGGGRVSEVLQTQAAWLYLQHTGNVEKALGRLFPGS